MTDADVVASLAVTLDGYVCRADGSVDYLEKYPIEEFDFAAFTDSIGALIMGSTSYLQAVEWGWMWGDRPTMVLTTRSDLPVPDGADIRFSAMPTAAAIRSFAQQSPKRLWVFGGGKVVTEGLQGGAIDTLDITIMPEAIGGGIPLFAGAYDGPMRLVETTGYANGAVRLIYDTRPI
jgi:dihydrofolate reductase